MYIDNDVCPVGMWKTRISLAAGGGMLQVINLQVTDVIFVILHLYLSV
jgi:hypothetical protein